MFCFPENFGSLRGAKGISNVKPFPKWNISFYLYVVYPGIFKLAQYGTTVFDIIWIQNASDIIAVEDSINSTI